MATGGSSLWALVHGWHLDLVYRDICHIAFLGIGKDIAGSLMLEFAETHLQDNEGLHTLDEALHFL